MENKLISMVDFVLEQSKIHICGKNGRINFSNKVIKYATFLKQPLKLGMFVPCDEIDESLNYGEIKQSVIEGTETWDIWENAKDRVLFDGFDEHQAKLTCELYYTIEDLINFNLTLTASAIKQFEL
jgi:hypothetical protein